MSNTIQYNRNQVLAKASEVFQKKGFNGASMQDLVDATGLNRSSIYNSFGSKMDLYVASLDIYRDQNAGIQQSLVNDAKDGLSAIKSIFDIFIKTIVNDVENKGCMIVNCKTELASTGDKSILNWLLNSDKKGMELFENVIKRGQKDGSINSKQSSKTYALYISTALQGFRMTGIMNKNKGELEVLASSFINQLK